MSEDDSLRYDKMVEDALRGVVREALATAARTGLTDDHHFYITFRTRFPGVGLSDLLLARHPEEMTIVLQHQFWDLQVDQSGFRVTLSFGGKSEVLIIPFAAITGFADPSVKFGLQFQAIEGEDGDDEAEDAPQDDPSDQTDAADAGDAPAESGGKVVALDAFRKK